MTTPKRSAKITSIYIPEELHKLIKERSVQNHRTFSAEMIYLIELGLTSSNEEVINILRLIKSSA